MECSTSFTVQGRLPVGLTKPSARKFPRAQPVGPASFPPNRSARRAAGLALTPARYSSRAAPPGSGSLVVRSGFPRFERQFEPVDPVMIWGDAIMITATELASDRIPISQAGMLAGIVLCAWVPISLIKGDYRQRSEATLFFQILLLNAMQSALLTWLLAAPAVLALLSFLVPANIVDGLVLMEPSARAASSAHGAPGLDLGSSLPPQLEVMVADLITMVCWRGVYAVFRL